MGLPPSDRRAFTRAVSLIIESTAFGGMELHTADLIDALLARGYRVELIANGHNVFEEAMRTRGWAGSVTLIHTRLAGITTDYSDFGGWRALLQNLRGTTLIFPKGENSHGRLGFLLACRLKFRHIVFIEHKEAETAPAPSTRQWLGFIPRINFWWLRVRLYRAACALCAERIIAVSERCRDRLISDWKLSPEKVVVVRNGVAWNRFVRDEETGAAARANLGVPADAFVFGMLVRLSPLKGVDIALQALRLLREANPGRPFRLVIAGDGPDERKLLQLREQLGLLEEAQFIGFARNPRELLWACDVILFSSRLEGLPLGLLEGMAAGCVPIVTRVSGMPEAVHNSEIGWIVAPENPQELFQAMQSALLTDGPRFAHMRANAVRRIQQEFDLEVAHRRLLEICDQFT
jgi:glycosyltransferase involved in cell wall biosynthesis